MNPKYIFGAGFLIYFIIVCPAIAQKIPSTLFYEKITLEKSNEFFLPDDILYLLKEMNIRLSKKENIQIINKDKTFKNWIISDGSNKGSITFHQSEDKGYYWLYKFKNTEIAISLSSSTDNDYGALNDPREIIITQGNSTYYIINNEPDYNSNFSLHKQSDADYEHPLLVGQAKGKLSNPNKWLFNLKDQTFKQDTHTQIAFMFTSAMSLTARQFYILNQLGKE